MGPGQIPTSLKGVPCIVICFVGAKPRDILVVRKHIEKFYLKNKNLQGSGTRKPGPIPWFRPNETMIIHGTPFEDVGI